MSSFLFQRAIRTRDKKFVLYGEPEGLREDSIETMDDSEFLKALYRKCMCRFESYDEFMKTLGMLRKGETTRKELYRKHH
ncbi:MAG: hypothetical protein GTO08_01950, partial [Deltaproteobacteria bacterium]|nr:hypothetical protein [Deltaproteobacteria bacterium]